MLSVSNQNIQNFVSAMWTHVEKQAVKDQWAEFMCPVAQAFVKQYAGMSYFSQRAISAELTRLNKSFVMDETGMVSGRVYKSHRGSLTCSAPGSYPVGLVSSWRAGNTKRGYNRAYTRQDLFAYWKENFDVNSLPLEVQSEISKVGALV